MAALIYSSVSPWRQHREVGFNAVAEITNRKILLTPDSEEDSDFTQVDRLSQSERAPTRERDDSQIHQYGEVHSLCGREVSGGFVETGWFHGLAAVIILVNCGTMFMEAKHPPMKETLFWPDQLILLFYIFELMCRAHFTRDGFLCRGPHFCWDLIDVVVVTAGVLDQWFFPLAPALERQESLQTLLQCLRCFRIIRVVKIMRIFMETDLHWTDKPPFHSFVGGVIVFNAMLMGLETDVKWDGWAYIEQVLLCIYVFELASRLKHFGWTFFTGHDITWNLLDFVIVVSSVTDTWVIPILQVVLASNSKSGNGGAAGMNTGQAMMLMRMLRLMRILRLVRLIKAVRPLYNLTTGILAAMQGVGWVLLFVVTVIYALGIVVTRIIGHGLLFPPGEAPEALLSPFSDVSTSMFTLFRIMSGMPSDEEATAVDDLMAELPVIKFGFVFFLITSSWTLLSILTAVISDNMIKTTQGLEEENLIANSEEERAVLKHELEIVMEAMDNNGNGDLGKEELDKFCESHENKMELARLCRVPARNVKDVFNSLHDTYEHNPSMEEFVDSLLDVSKVATEKSIMKLEARIHDVEKRSSIARTRQCSEITESLKALELRLEDLFSICKGKDKFGVEDQRLFQMIETLALQEKKSSETISASIQVLLQSHLALERQNTTFAEGCTLKTETSLASLERRSEEAMSSLQRAVEESRDVLKQFAPIAFRVQRLFETPGRGMGSAVGTNDSGCVDSSALPRSVPRAGAKSGSSLRSVQTWGPSGSGSLRPSALAAPRLATSELDGLQRGPGAQPLFRMVSTDVPDGVQRGSSAPSLVSVAAGTTDVLHSDVPRTTRRDFGPGAQSCRSRSTSIGRQALVPHEHEARQAADVASAQVDVGEPPSCSSLSLSAPPQN